MKKVSFACLLAEGLFFLCAFSAVTTPQKTASPKNAVKGEYPLLLKKALGSFSAERYKEELLWWACDERDGREPETKGSEESAQWAIARFKEFGLVPMGDKKGGKRSFFQRFTVSKYFARRLDIKNSMVRLGKKILKFGKDWAFLGGTRKAKIGRGSLAYAGFGESDETIMRARVKGKIAVVREGLEGKPLDMLTDPRPEWLKTFYSKVKRAVSFGAIALLLLPSPGKKRGLFSEHHDFVAWSNKGIPVIQISNETAASLLARLPQKKKGKSRIGSSFKNIKMEIQVSCDSPRKAKNIIGLWKGSDPVLSREFVIIGAHRDHIGIGAYGSRARRRRGEVHNGADDNATGAVGVIELARAFSSSGLRPKRSILFMLFDAEEMGLLGSFYWTEHPTVPLKRVAAMINMDMIGRVRDNKAKVLGVGSSPAWNKILEDAMKASSLEWDEIYSGFGGSDHIPFLRKGIPILFFHSGLHKDYHTPDDDPEKCNPKGAVEILKVLLCSACAVANLPRKPAFRKSISRGRRRVRLGAILRQTAKGPVVKKVQEGSPASKAGIKEGDLIVSVDGRRVRRISDVYRRLRRKKKGQTVTIILNRGGKEIKKEISM